MNQEQLLAFIANCERVKQQAIEEMAKEEHEHEKDFFDSLSIEELVTEMGYEIGE